MNVMKNLCIVLTDEGRKKIKEEREKKFGSQEIAALDIGIPQGNISRWERGANPKFFSFRSYLQRLGIYQGFYTNKIYVTGTVYHGFQIKKIKSTKLSKEKAYVLGVVGPGDGYINGKYSIGLNVCDKDFADYFQKCVENTFGLKCRRSRRISKPTKKVKKPSKQYVVGLDAKSVVESLKRYGVSFKEKTWRIPEIIKKASSTYKAMYLKGIFDSQACVNVAGKSILVGIKNKEGIKDIRSLLKGIGIKSSIYKDETHLLISSQQYLKSYYHQIGFALKRKEQDLLRLLKSYKHEISPYLQTLEKVPSIIHLKRQGLSTSKVASLTNTSRATVRKYISLGEY